MTNLLNQNLVLSEQSLLIYGEKYVAVIANRSNKDIRKIGKDLETIS
jgi:hypothetical protein